VCGIFGCYRSQVNIQNGLDRLRHRGPDGQGIATCGLATHGHVRLAILDLTDASGQPFVIGKSVLSFVGEIWNYRELRTELERHGRVFRTTGDTEVLAVALDVWGLDALPRLDGMFTFAWSKGQSHVIARDRFGKIPIYVQRAGKSFVWSSERKGFDRPGVGELLPPGSYLDMASGKIHKWYLLPSNHSSGEVLGLLRNGVRKRLNADAPLCCLISGGLDSSLVLSLALETRPDIVAYTARFDSKSSDLISARRICRDLSVPLVEVPVSQPTERMIREAIRSIEINSKAQVEIAILCLPLARQIAADGFKACLSGEAADELFGGYGNMCIQGASATDQEWKEIRIQQLAKMARGNFIRCNKVFMAHGVECRLPFMDRELVETVISMNKVECPPGKKKLKQAARAILPSWIINRAKETFQGASGIATACARLISSPTLYYNAEARRLFG
jgi:asparagine synthase (glutamine-hydrolysing)